IVLSRPGLWSVSPPRELAARFGWFFDPDVERLLFIALIVLLAMALFSRVACFGAALLLYHFAPLEEALARSGDPFMHGLTADFPWPVVLVRFAAAAPYLFSAVAKGIGWFTGPNIADVARTFSLIGVAPYAKLVIDHAAVAWLIAIGWLIVSIGMPLAVISRRVAAVIVPLVAIAHVAAIPLFGVLI